MGSGAAGGVSTGCRVCKRRRTRGRADHAATSGRLTCCTVSEPALRITTTAPHRACLLHRRKSRSSSACARACCCCAALCPQRDPAAMANIKSLSDLNGEGDGDDNGKFNDYYAGGEKRCVVLPGEAARQRMISFCAAPNCCCCCAVCLVVAAAAAAHAACTLAPLMCTCSPQWTADQGSARGEASSRLWRLTNTFASAPACLRAHTRPLSHQPTPTPCTTHAVSAAACVAGRGRRQR